MISGSIMIVIFPAPIVVVKNLNLVAGELKMSIMYVNVHHVVKDHGKSEFTNDRF